MHALELNDSNILLTGATGEIGHGLLKSLVKRSPARVFAPSSNEANLAGLKLLFSDVLIEPVHCDLSDEAGIDALVQTTQKILGPKKALDLVLFGAGMLGVNGREAFPTWKNALKTLALNALGPDFCFQKLVDSKLLQPGSTVIALGSISGHKSYFGAQNLSAYTLSKAALNQAVKNWAKNHPNMTIFEVALGAVQTKMLEACKPSEMSIEDWQASLMHDIPIQEVGDPEVVAETIVRLLETPGHRLFHGDVIHLSGGERL